MPANPDASLEGFKIYRASFLPGFGRPLVFISWCQLNVDGFSIIQVQYIVVDPTGPIKVEGVSTDRRYLPRTLEVASAMQTLSAMALDRAEEAIEKVTGQGVTLAEINWDTFQVVAYREGFRQQWQEVSQCTGCSDLRSRLYEMEQSQLMRVAKFEVMVTRWY